MKYLILFASLFWVSCLEQTVDPPIDPAAKFTLLEDLIHAGRQTTHVVGSFDNLAYDKSHGYSSFAEYLETLEIALNRVTNGRLSSSLLENVDVLFINLTDNRVKEFSGEEIDAVEAYVEGGGGLIVVVDHTNAYQSAARINPLLAAFGLEVTNQTAMDIHDNCAKGNHWLLTDPERTDSAHAVSQGVRSAGFFAAGPILGPGSVAWTSDDGWRDEWDPSSPPSYWGDFRQGRDEPNVSSSIMNAVEFGQGRVAVVGDQNIFGNTYLGFADNKILLANTLDWLTQNDGPAFREIATTKPQIQVEFRGRSHSSFWNSGYSTFFDALSRQRVFDGALLLNEPDRTPEFLIVVEPELYDVAITDRAHPETVLDEGGEVFFFLDPKNPKPAALELIQSYWEDFEAPSVGARDFEGAQFAGLPGRKMEVADDVLDVDSAGESIYWLEDGDGERSDLIVSEGRVHVIVQPAVFQKAAYIYAREALFDELARRQEEPKDSDEEENDD